MSDTNTTRTTGQDLLNTMTNPKPAQPATSNVGAPPQVPQPRKTLQESLADSQADSQKKATQLKGQNQ